MNQTREWYIEHAKSFRASTLAEKLGVTIEQARKIKAGTAPVAAPLPSKPIVESEDADVSEE